MKIRRTLGTMLPAIAVAGLAAFAGSAATAPQSSWNPRAAATYLDTRESWWQTWPMAQRDHGTICVSCHTVVPYALARPVLRRQLGENAPNEAERVLYNNVVRRVTLWKEVKPFYNDPEYGPNKSIESRTTEAVLNAIILASHDAQQGHLSEIARQAFNQAWTMQRTSAARDGEKAGSWLWLNFHNSPWEGYESEYHWNALAARAVGLAPDDYRNDPGIKPHLDLLRGYLRRGYRSQPLINQVALLWAASKLPGLLTASERADLVRTVYAAQQSDGGWSLSRLGAYKRRDDTPLETRSDGYATGLIVLAMEDNGVSSPQVARGLGWLRQNQAVRDGRWPAWSVNARRDPDSDIGHFMTDAATSYAVLALEHGR